MLEHLVAIGAALVALALVYFVFRSIAKTDITGAPQVKQNKPSTCPVKAKKPKDKKSKEQDEKFNRKMDALIAREVSRENVSMRSDTRNPQPTLLEDVQKGNHRRSKAQEQSRGETSYKQLEVVKESGFHTVTGQRKEGPQPQQRQQQQQKQTPALKTMVVDEAMERKLSHFFSNLNKKERLARANNAEEKPVADKGATIIIKKDFTNTRSWQQQQQ